MLRTAPKFYEVAKRIVEITEDCIIVAHNAEFDYRILCTEFGRLGFDYKRKTLCTVELAKEIMPGQDSYSLGKLTKTLGIPVNNRHRASGDALATVKLFKILLTKDLKKHIIQDTVKAEPKYQMTRNVKSMIDALPTVPGVYYMHDIYGKIIFIGSGKNIKSRVNQHFTNPRSKRIQNHAAAVTYELTGNELIAALKENAEIKQNKPSLNKVSRKPLYPFALYRFTDENGYSQLRLEPTDRRKKAIIAFSNKKQGRKFLLQAMASYKLCPKLIGLDQTKSSCFKYSNNECDGACINEEGVEDYNLKINQLIAKNSLERHSLIILDKGRSTDEQSVIFIDNGIFKGYGYYNLNFQITNRKVLTSIITPMEHTQDIQHIIQNYLRKNKHVKTVELSKAEVIPKSTN